MARTVAVVDYGVGNLFSVDRGLRAAGLNASFVQDADRLRDYDALILPGVGAFAVGMERLQAVGMDAAIKDFVTTGKPLLGICLGMQFLLGRSFEFGEHAGLGLIPGDVVDIPEAPGWTVPNVGWSDVTFTRDPVGTPFAQTVNGTDFYFVHSFYCRPADPADLLATIDYAGESLPVIVSRGNVHGCQFHPELSDRQGLNIFHMLQEMD